MQQIRRMSIQEFRDFGFLQEVNRQFFHPLGLALEVIVDEQGNVTQLGGVWDYRDDPEGIVFEEVDLEKAARILELQKQKAETRQAKLGYVIQPLST